MLLLGSGVVLLGYSVRGLPPLSVGVGKISVGREFQTQGFNDRTSRGLGVRV